MNTTETHAPISLTPKMREILSQVQSVFAQNGFEGTSMQDLARATNMSVGNFYRYFSSKRALVTAMVEQDLEQIQTDFKAVHAAEDPHKVFMEKVAEKIRTLSMGEAALWTEMQAASFRCPEIADLKRKMEVTVRQNIIGALVRIHGVSDPAHMARFERLAHFTMLTLHGYAQHKYCSRDMADKATSDALAQMVIDILERALFAPPENPD